MIRPWETSEAPDTADAFDALLEALDGSRWTLADDQDEARPASVLLASRDGEPDAFFPTADAAHRFLLEEDGSFGPGGEEGGW